MRSLPHFGKSFAILFCLSSYLTSCAWTPTAIESGLGGAAIGAGTGAIVGSVIKDGNILASAGLGGLIGLPAGLAASRYYQRYLEEKRLQEEQKLIYNQQNQIVENEKILRTLRDQMHSDHVIELDKDRRNLQYDGPTLEDYYR